MQDQRRQHHRHRNHAQLEGLVLAQSVASFAASASNCAPDATLAAAHVG
jgi:hypothetical protein